MDAVSDDRVPALERPASVGDADEDLVLAALNEAQQRAQSLYEEEMKKLAGGLPPLPFNL